MGKKRNHVTKILQIEDVRMTLQILRCFGHMITKISLQFDFHEDQVPYKGHLYILNYMNEYCTDSLIKLSMHTVCAHIDSLKKPFLNVEEIEITTFAYVHRFNKLFPRVRRLIFQWIGNVTPCLSKYFPHLKHVEMILGICSDKTDRAGFAGLLRSNPQLRSLIYIDNNPRFIVSMQKYLQSIEILHLKIENCLKKNASNNTSTECIRIKTIFK